MTKPLAGKVALVTGGARGIGAAIAERLADDGADVAFSYVASAERATALAKQLAAKGVRVETFQADQADAQAVARLVDQVAKKFGRIDILVNSAGVAVMGALGTDAPPAEEFDRQLRVNVSGVAAAVRAVVKHMPDGGRIISIGSCLGSAVPFPGIADYAATKAAVAGYTRGWARDLGSRGITVNAVQPGPIDTDMNPADSDFAAAQTARTALGRYGRPAEVAAAVAFLAGPDASYITGAALEVDGGFNA